MTDRRWLIAALLLSLAFSATGADDAPSSDEPRALPPESLLRQYRVSREDEDWRWLLRGSQYPDLFDGVKAMPFSANGPIFGVGSDPDPKPSIDKNSLDVQQLFADLPLAENSVLRLGRQELSLGVGRMVSARAGPINVRQPQDGARLMFDLGESRLDAFGVRITNVKQGTLDDSSSDGDRLHGLYWTRGQPYVSPRGVETYLLSHLRDVAIYFSGAGPEDRYSLGVRGWFPVGRWSHDIEAVYQIGDFSGGNVVAWALSTLSTRRFDTTWSPELEIASGFNSGDRNPGDGDVNTFVAPLPRGGYFGAFAPFGPGNMQGARVSLSISPTANASLFARVYGFWRQSTDDGLYGVSGFPVVAPVGGTKFVGVQRELGAELAIDTHLTVGFEIAYFNRGKYLEGIPNTQDIRSLGVVIRYRF